MDFSSASRLPVAEDLSESDSPPRWSADGEQRMRRMVDQHFDLVWRSLRRFGVQEAGVDDAAQQVFWVIARKLDRVQPEAERAFLMSTAMRIASDARRAQNRRRGREEEEGDWECVELDTPSADDLLDAKRARGVLDRILELMPLDIRTVFVLYEGEGCTASEISELLEIPTGTVASRLRRARELFGAEVARIKARMQHPGSAT